MANVYGYGHATSVPESERLNASTEQAQEETVVKVFRTLGGRDIERGEGTVADGRWQTFDPLKPMNRIDQDHGR